jgi:hypothetical protein
MQRFVLRFWYSIIAVFIVLLIVAPASAVVGVIVKKVIDRQAVLPDELASPRNEFVDIDPMPAEDVVAPSTQQRVTLGSGAAHTCVVVYSGLVMCWGANDEGQLGFGNDGKALPFSRAANVVASLQDVTSVAVGLRHSCALMPSPGTVWCWGSNVTRQIGQHSIGHALFAQCKQVDVLGATGFFGGKCQLFLLSQGVDAGRFAGIGPTHKGDFRGLQGGQMVQLRSGG